MFNIVEATIIGREAQAIDQGGQEGSVSVEGIGHARRSRRGSYRYRPKPFQHGEIHESGRHSVSVLSWDFNDVYKVCASWLFFPSHVTVSANIVMSGYSAVGCSLFVGAWSVESSSILSLNGFKLGTG